MAEVARLQHGVFSVAQVLDAGGDHQLIYRRVRSGRWRRVGPRVVCHEGSPRSWHQEVMAMVLTAGAGALASHRAAAFLYKLDGFEGAPEPEVAVPRGRRCRRGLVHQMADTLPADVSKVDGIPCTSVLRTLFDLAGVVDVETLERAVECALRRRLVTFKQLEWRSRLLARRGRRGAGAMIDLLERRGNVAATQSDLETRFFQLLRRSGLPLPQRQYEVRRSDGRRAFVDFAYPAHRIAIELDGADAHGFLHAGGDRARQNELILLGWRVLRFSWDDVVRHPDAVVEAIARALGDASVGERA